MRALLGIGAGAVALLIALAFGVWDRIAPLFRRKTKVIDRRDPESDPDDTDPVVRRRRYTLDDDDDE